MGKSTYRSRISASISRIARVSGMCAALGAIGLWLYANLLPAEGRIAALNTFEQPPSSLIIFERIAPTELDEIHIAFPSGIEHQLRREGEQWSILDGDHWFPLNPDRAAGLFGSAGGGAELLQGSRGILQGSNPANHDRAFGVSANRGTLVTFLANGMEAEQLVIGRSVKGSGGWTTYVRRPDSNAVYQVSGKLSDNFSGEMVHTWRRRFLFPGVTSGDIREVGVLGSDDQTSYTLTRSKDSSTGWWLSTEGSQTEADGSIAEALAEWIIRLRTADFLEMTATETRGEPIAQVELGIVGYETPVMLRAFRSDQIDAIIRLEVDSPRERESGSLGVFDLMPLWRDARELVHSPNPTESEFAEARHGANESFALGAGEKF